MPLQNILNKIDIEHYINKINVTDNELNIILGA